MKACCKGSSKLMPLISPFRLNQNITGGEIVLLVREAIPANIIVSPNLSWEGGGSGVGGGVFYPSCWFSRNNSETVKAVTLTFCSIYQHFIRDIHVKFCISYSLQSPDIGQNSDGGISRFLVNPL